MKTLKLNSFGALAHLVNADKTTPEKWADFLKEKGHTDKSFSYLPEELKTSLKFSFAKRNAGKS